MASEHGAFLVVQSSAKQSWSFQISFPARRAKKKSENLLQKAHLLNAQKFDLCRGAAVRETGERAEGLQSDDRPGSAPGCDRIIINLHTVTNS